MPPPMPVIAPRMTACTGPEPEVQRLAGAGDAEHARGRWRRRPARRAGCAPARGPAKKHDQPGRAGRGQVAPVAEGRRRHADEQVAGDAARQPDDRREHDDAEQVQPRADGGEPAAEPEDERADQVQPRGSASGRSRAARPSPSRHGRSRGPVAYTGRASCSRETSVTITTSADARPRPASTAIIGRPGGSLPRPPRPPRALDAGAAHRRPGRRAPASARATRSPRASAARASSGCCATATARR